MNCQRLFGTIALTAGFCAPGFGQGGDCASATPIGTGVLSTYSTGVFTTSGFTGGGTCSSLLLESDAFWLWTAPADGDYLIEFLNAKFEMGFRVHSGNDCTATCIAVGFNPTSLHPQVGLTSVTAGDQFLVQAGATNAADGTADLLIRSVVNPCIVNGPDAFEPNETCNASSPMALGAHPGLNVELASPDYYSVVVPAGNTLQVMETQDTLQTVEYLLFRANCQSAIVAGSQGVEWSNDTGVPQTIVVKAEQAPNAPFDCAGYGLNLSVVPDPCQVAPDDSFEPNDSCSQVSPIVDGTYTNLFVSRSDKDMYSICVASGATISCSVTFPILGADLDIFLHDPLSHYCTTGLGNGSLFGASTFANPETLTWTNVSTVDRNLILEIRVRDIVVIENCNTYEMTITGAQSCDTYSGTPFCDPMDANSTGLPTLLRGQSSAGAGAGWRLMLTDGPFNQFGIVLVGSASTSPGVPISQGRLCLDGSGMNVFGRYNYAGTDRNSLGVFNLFGDFINLSNTSASGFGFDVPSSLPLPGNPSISAGQTWHFQAWHRENMGQANFSNGLSITF